MKAFPVIGFLAVGGSLFAFAASSQTVPHREPQKQPPAPAAGRSPLAQPPPASDDDDAAYLATLAQRSLEENCLICHEENMISRQRLTPIQWKAEIDKMISWGAPLPAEAQQPLIDFLSRLYSDRQPLPEPQRMALGEIDSLEPVTPGSSVTISRGDPVSGERLYATNCANCHGAKALGAELGPCLVNKAILDHPEAYHRVVRNGLRRMPGFQKVLNAVQEDDLLSWLREQRYP
jgi:mono/diheme cytochrome c family protein